MSAIGPKRTFTYAAFYVAIGGKADMTGQRYVWIFGSTCGAVRR